MAEKIKDEIHYGIDKSVLTAMLVVIIVSLSVFAYKIVKHKPCDIVNFDIEAQEYRVGEIIRFKDFSNDANTRKWNFGDSTALRYDLNPFHTYDKSGKYLITLTVNDRCDFSKEIVIKDKIPTIDSTKIANFEIPKSIKVGELLVASDKTKGATSWEWRFGETSKVNSTYQNPTYSYKKAGLKTITLIVNGDPRYSSQKQINVLPANQIKKLNSRKPAAYTPDPVADIVPYSPPTEVIANAPPGEKVAEEKIVKKPSISRGAFAAKIIQISEEKATAKDFRKYLCGGNLQTSTSAKGKKTTFIEFCEKIKGKKIKIKSLELFKNKKTNCIEYISIDYSKGFF